jgi:hypothetical protein
MRPEHVRNIENCSFRLLNVTKLYTLYGLHLRGVFDNDVAEIHAQICIATFWDMTFVYLYL